MLWVYSGAGFEVERLGLSQVLCCRGWVWADSTVLQHAQGLRESGHLRNVKKIQMSINMSLHSWIVVAASVVVAVISLLLRRSQ